MEEMEETRSEWEGGPIDSGRVGRRMDGWVTDKEVEQYC